MPHYTDDFDEPPPARCATHPARPAVRVAGPARCMECHIAAHIPPAQIAGVLMTHYERETACEAARLRGRDWR